MAWKPFTNLLLCGIVIIFTLFLPPCFAGDIPIIKTGDIFPRIMLKLPPYSDHEQYLGISEPGFMVEDIKADLVLVEIMNINCGSCQEQAPVYNTLYDKIESSEETAGKVKIMAVSAGNKNEHIKKFQDHFKAPYPIIEDPEFIVYRAIGQAPVPMAVFVRPNKDNNKAVVVGTHTGLISDPETLFNEIRSLMPVSAKEAESRGKQIEKTYVRVRPAITEKAAMEKISAAFKGIADDYTYPEKVILRDNSVVYTGVRSGSKLPERIFARIVSQPPPCDVCHDAHYIYIFNSSGKIIQFLPISLSGYGNQPWTEEEITRMKNNLVGRHIQNRFSFDPETDAITGATITSLVIVESLNEGKLLFEELENKGLINSTDSK